MTLHYMLVITQKWILSTIWSSSYGKLKREIHPLGNTSHCLHCQERETVRFIPTIKWGVFICLDFQVRSSQETGRQNNLMKSCMDGLTKCENISVPCEVSPQVLVVEKTSINVELCKIVQPIFWKSIKSFPQQHQCLINGLRKKQP